MASFSLLIHPWPLVFCQEGAEEVAMLKAQLGAGSRGDADLQQQIRALHKQVASLHQEREQLQQSCAAYEQRCRQLEEEAEGHMTIPSAKQEAEWEARKQFLALQEELSAVKKSLQVWPCVGSRASGPLMRPLPGGAPLFSLWNNQQGGSSSQFFAVFRNFPQLFAIFS